MSPELALHLVPPSGEPLVGHLRIVDKFSIFPPTTHVGKEFPKVVQDRKDLIEYRQANLTVPGQSSIPHYPHNIALHCNVPLLHFYDLLLLPHYFVFFTAVYLCRFAPSVFRKSSCLVRLVRLLSEPNVFPSRSRSLPALDGAPSNELRIPRTATTLNNDLITIPGIRGTLTV